MGRKAEPTRHPEIVDAYRRFMVAGNYSANTIEQRLRHVRRFEDHWPLLTPTSDDLIRMLAGASMSAASRHALRSSMKHFYGWAYGEGLTPDNPSDRLPSIRVGAGVPKPVPDDVLRQVLTTVDDRVRLMLMLGALAGLRRAEIARVHSDDVTAEGLRVFGKGGKTRLVPLLPELRDELERVDGWAFPSSHGSGPLAPRYVSQLIGQALPKPWTAHTLRHRFATRAYQATHDIRAVQELLGHSSVATTQRYTAVGEEALMSAVMAVSLH